MMSFGSCVRPNLVGKGFDVVVVGFSELHDSLDRSSYLGLGEMVRVKMLLGIFGAGSP